MSLSLKKESGIFENSLLPADAQAGLVNEIQDKLKRAIGGDTQKKPLYLAVSNFSYPGPEVLNTPFDFSADKPAEVKPGVELFGPLPEQLAGAMAFELQEASVLSRQRFRKGDRGQLIYLAHIGDGQRHLCFKVGEEVLSADARHGRVAPEKVVEISANTARITFEVQARPVQAGILEQWWDRQINDDWFADEQQRVQTAVEHLKGVDRGQALLLEALGYPWNTDDETYQTNPTKLLK